MFACITLQSGELRKSKSISRESIRSLVILSHMKVGVPAVSDVLDDESSSDTVISFSFLVVH